MAAWGTCDFSELKQFAERLEKLEDDRQKFCEACARELAARFLRMVIRRTPAGRKPVFLDKNGEKKPNTEKVKGASGKSRSFLTREGAILQQYWSGYSGGTLRRGWTAKTESEAEKNGKPADPTKYVAGMRVNKRGAVYEIVVYNPVHYASYVEYGHRQLPGRYVPAIGKQLKRPWAKGKFMMTTTAKSIQAAAPKVIEKKLKQWLERGINGK